MIGLGQQRSSNREGGREKGWMDVHMGMDREH